MSQSKRNMIQQAATELTKEFVDQGKLIEAGFAAFRVLVMPKDAPPIQVSEMRIAWMAGADFLFSSIMATLDAGDDATEADMRRLDLIHRELERFRVEVSQRIQPVKGHA